MFIAARLEGPAWSIMESAPKIASRIRSRLAPFSRTPFPLPVSRAGRPGRLILPASLV